jgi:hypothetical protein
MGLIFSVGGAFFGYVAGGWVAARIAGRVRSEPAMLHGGLSTIAVRNNALATAPALLIGLIGAVLGGWMASGEPMTFTHYRTRDRVAGA